MLKNEKLPPRPTAGGSYLLNATGTAWEPISALEPQAPDPKPIPNAPVKEAKNHGTDL
jgi:hypothetical protein